jgi:hypothetical protein
VTVNSYFTDHDVSPIEDQALVEDLIIESIQIKGRDHKYLPRTLTNFDSFLGEDSISAFNGVATIEMYLENVNAWQDDGSFMSKFGLEIRDSASLVCSIKRFAEEVTTMYPSVIRPMEGDIIAFPSPIDARMRLFEISYVNPEHVFYQIGKNYTYQIKVKNFEFNGESFTTGDTTIDAYDTNNAIVTDITVNAGVGAYVIGEQVGQLSGWSGEVVSFVGNELSVMKVRGEFNHTDPIMGNTSGTVRTVSIDPGPHVDGLDVSPVNNDAMLNDQANINHRVLDGLINFSENNPFSE